VGRLAILTLAVCALLMGTAQGRVTSSSIEGGESPEPSVDSWLKRPSAGGALEVRALPRAPVVVTWRIHCRSKQGNRVVKHRMTTDAFPVRIRMPVLIPRPRYCQLSADASYESFDQDGRIGMLIRYRRGSG
jgi:hypothetical protein